MYRTVWSELFVCAACLFNSVFFPETCYRRTPATLADVWRVGTHAITVRGRKKSDGLSMPCPEIKDVYHNMYHDDLPANPLRSILNPLTVPTFLRPHNLTPHLCTKTVLRPHFSVLVYKVTNFFFKIPLSTSSAGAKLRLSTMHRHTTNVPAEPPPEYDEALEGRWP